MVEAHGSGSRRRFSRRDVRAVRLVHQLRALGAPMGAIAGASSTLQEADVEWAGPILVTEQGVVLDVSEVLVGLHRGVTGWVVDLTMWDE